MKILHLICNAHIDPVWQWKTEEGLAQSLSTFWSACNLAEEFDYIFCHNEALLYEYIEQNDEKLFGRIKELISAGKWKIIGGWYLQPDCTMLSGESAIRQVRYGKKYFVEKFGSWSKIAVNFDSFGHSRGLVQVIKKNGQEGYLFTRPQQWQKDLPDEEILWVGYDGSQIKAIRAGDCYGTDMGKVLGSLENRTDYYDKENRDLGIFLWGVGNHGGGPSRKDLDDIKNYKSEEWQLVHSTPETYFDLSKPTKSFEESLILCMPGCYTSICEIKQKHVYLENLSAILEKISAFSSVKTGGNVGDFTKIYKMLMLSQFHDALPGTSVKEGVKQVVALLDSAINETETLINRSFVDVIKHEKKAEEGEIPFFIFNPNPYEYAGDFELEFMLPNQNWQNVKGCNVQFNGKEIDSQILKEESNINLDWRKKVVVNCTLKPFEVSRLSIFLNDDGENFEPVVPTENIVIKNKFFEVVISKETGKIISLKKDGVQYIEDDSFGLYMFDDNADPWGMSVKQMQAMGENPVAFDPYNNYDEYIGNSNVRIIEDGKLITRIEAFFKANDTTARIEYTISKTLPILDVKVDLFVGDKEKMIKLKVPVAIEGTYIGEQTFGTEELFDNGKECVSHRFVAVKDKEDNCLALLNNCIYGSSYVDKGVYLSLVRNVSYCTHPIPGRELKPKNRYIKYAEFGERNFAFRIAMCKENELARLAQEFNQIPQILNFFPSGKYDTIKSDFIFEQTNKNIVVSAFKKSVEKDGYILRLFNNHKDINSTELSIMGNKVLLAFSPYEVKTFLVTENCIKEEEEMYL